MTATTVGRTVGWAPQWWSSGVRTRLWWAAAIVFPVITVADLYVTWGWAEAGGYPSGAYVVGFTGVTAEAVVGLLFWMWRPGNIVGPLLVLYAALALVGDPPGIWPTSRLVVTIGFLFWWMLVAVYVHMLLVFPNGEFSSRWARPLSAVQYVWALLLFLPALLFMPDGIVGSGSPSEVASYFYVGHGWSHLDAWDEIWWTGQLAIILAVVVLLLVRLRRATPGARRRLLPLTLVAATVLPFQYFYVTIHAYQDEPWDSWFYYCWWGFFGLSAAGAAFGLSRVRHARGAVSDLVVELGQVEPGEVREALARTLGDPTLVLGLWLPQRGVWADEQGRELAVPTDRSRGVTYLGDRLAVLIHDRDLLDQPRLLESVGSAARLALENERLHAQLRAQLVELQESRARIVKAGDEERRRLERDLHDGAQQRLLALGMGLQLLQGHVDASSEELLQENERELRHALQELRELAQGIHPAALTDNGLGDAVRTLAQRAPVPVDVEVDESMGRLPGHVETAAYFVVAEALANIAKYADATEARVTVGRTNSQARIEIQDDGNGGATPDRGSGLRGLTDRVGALDGQLTIDSPPGKGTRIIAEIPCTS